MSKNFFPARVQLPEVSGVLSLVLLTSPVGCRVWRNGFSRRGHFIFLRNRTEDLINFQSCFLF